MVAKIAQRLPSGRRKPLQRIAFERRDLAQKVFFSEEKPDPKIDIVERNHAPGPSSAGVNKEYTYIGIFKI